MVLRDGEYKIEDEGIWISKKALEKWRDHYMQLHNQYAKKKDSRYLPWMFMGEYSVCVDLIKMFEPLMV
jgi:hypothetical protein